jgi:hypothetical protein
MTLMGAHEGARLDYSGTEGFFCIGYENRSKWRALSGHLFIQFGLNARANWQRLKTSTFLSLSDPHDWRVSVTEHKCI